MKDFCFNDISGFGPSIDANNFYGETMEKLAIPLKLFRKTNIPLQQILNTTADSTKGYFLEVDLKYLDVSHNNQKDFPLERTKNLLTKNSSVILKFFNWKQWVSKE